MKSDIPGTNYYKKKLTNFSGTVEKVFFSRAPRRKRAGWTGFLYWPLCLGSARGHVSHSAMVHGRRAAGRAATVAPLRRGSNAFCTADISGAAGPRLPGKVWRVATDAARRTGCTYGGALCDSGGNGGTVRWCWEEGRGRRWQGEGARYSLNAAGPQQCTQDRSHLQSHHVSPCGHAGRAGCCPC